MKPWVPWIPLAVVGALAALAVAAAQVSQTVRHWIVESIWHPIAYDLGYNAANTTLLILLAAAGLLWLTLLFRLYNEPVDLRVALGGLAFFAWAVPLRVFEDADLFSPFDAQLRLVDNAPGGACMPDPQHWTECFGVFFITPLLWIWLALVMWGFARMGLHFQWLDQAGRKQAAKFRAYIFLAGVWLAVLLLWVFEPSWMAAAPTPWISGLIALVAAYAISRQPTLHWTYILIAAPSILAGANVALLIDWFLGRHAAWGPQDATRAYLILWSIIALALLLIARRSAARWLSQRTPATAKKPKVSAPWLQLYLDAATALFVFAGLVGIVLWHEGRGSMWGAWPVLGLLLVPRAARTLGRIAGDVRMTFFAGGYGLIMLGGQAADAIVTAIGLDVLGAGEKHLLPRILIDWLAAANPPAPISDFPAATVLLAYKLGLVVLASWFLGVRAESWSGTNMRRLALLVVGFVGGAPALRNLLRTAMGV